jgi:predicted MPP superfamily phosphohydrolase
MGILFLLVVLLGLSDLVLWLWGALAGTDALTDAGSTRLAVVGLLAGAAAVYGLRSGLSYPAVRRVEIVLARWPPALDGFRIVQISDIHIGPLLDRTFAAEVTRRVNDLAPDLVAITGDLVDGPVRHVGPEVEPFRALSARHGVFFVTGNHDHMSRADEWTQRVGELGIRVLRNARVPIDVAGTGFDIVGVDDHRGDLVGGEGGEDLELALHGRDESRFALLLAHDPTTFKRAAGSGIDLQLSGHTHGGQIWPFALAVRLVVPYVAGLHRVGDALLYVSRGTGFWGPPIRLLAPAEITELILRARGGGGPVP